MASENPPFTLNPDVIAEALQAKGYKSVRDFAERLGLHRNTVGNYLNGQAVLPEALERMLLALDLSPGQALRETVLRRKVPGLRITRLLEQLGQAAPENAIVLFGSRARGTHKPFSDYDLGVFREAGIPFQKFSRLLDITEEWNGQELSTVQLVNLSAADEQFLHGICNDACFVGGNTEQWAAFLKKSGVVPYE